MTVKESYRTFGGGGGSVREWVTLPMIMSPRNNKPGSNYDLTIVTGTKKHSCQVQVNLERQLMATGEKEDGFYPSTTITMKNTEFVCLES